MAERRPAGFNVDLGFYDSPEVLSIPREIRAAAVGVWTLAGAYSANQLTDGYVSDEILKTLGCKPSIRAALMATCNADGSPSPLWIEAETGGILFTRWAKWQRTSTEVHAYRLAESERKKRSRAAARRAVSSGDENSSAQCPPGRSPDVRPDSRDPKTKTKTKTKTTNGYVGGEGNVRYAPARNGATAPPPQCLKHPSGPEHDENCRACAAVRKWAEGAEARQAADYRAAHREYNELAAEARARGCEWRPVKPPRFASEFDPDHPWHQPQPPPWQQQAV